MYKRGLSAVFKHLGKTGVNRILFPLLLSEFAVKALAEVCTQCASSMHTTAWSLASFPISFWANESVRFHTKCNNLQGNNCRIGIEVKQVLSVWVHSLGWDLVCLGSCIKLIIGISFLIEPSGFPFPKCSYYFCSFCGCKQHSVIEKFCLSYGRKA